MTYKQYECCTHHLGRTYAVSRYRLSWAILVTAENVIIRKTRLSTNSAKQALEKNEFRPGKPPAGDLPEANVFLRT